MATHKTDPYGIAPTSPPNDTATTTPGDRPEHAEAAEARDPGPTSEQEIAASLLADLAKAPLPAEDVRETEGHAAAAYAVPAHKPPRANDQAVDEPAVLVNATMPIPAPLASSPRVDEPDTEATVVGGAERFFSTSPSARVHVRRARLASIGGAAVAAVLAIVVVVLTGAPRQATNARDSAVFARPAATAGALASASVAAPSASAVVLPVASAPVSALAPDPNLDRPVAAPVRSAVTAPAAMRGSPAAAAVKPAVSSRPTPSPPPSTSSHPSRPSGNYEEPDRTF